MKYRKQKSCSTCNLWLPRNDGTDYGLCKYYTAFWDGVKQYTRNAPNPVVVGIKYHWIKACSFWKENSKGREMANE